ncbi:MAG: MaoC family dehydratase [Acidobacteria bacterium]|nr:MaoC family dehydratase [Acidobacteriota bacterium]
MTQEREVVEQRGLWLEEFTVGTLYRHRPGRTVTEADNVIFSTLTMNPQPLHLDAAWSAEQVFGQRLVNSLFTLSTLVGLSISQLTLGTLVANLGFRDVTFPHPVFIGDTLYGESVVTSTRPSKSRPGEGVIEVEHIARNQEGVIVAQCHRAMLVLRRPVDR